MQEARVGESACTHCAADAEQPCTRCSPDTSNNSNSDGSGVIVLDNQRAEDRLRAWFYTREEENACGWTDTNTLHDASARVLSALLRTCASSPSESAGVIFCGGEGNYNTSKRNNTTRPACALVCTHWARNARDMEAIIRHYDAACQRTTIWIRLSSTHAHTLVISGTTLCDWTLCARAITQCLLRAPHTRSHERLLARHVEYAIDLHRQILFDLCGCCGRCGLVPGNDDDDEARIRMNDSDNNDDNVVSGLSFIEESEPPAALPGCMWHLRVPVLPLDEDKNV